MIALPTKKPEVEELTGSQAISISYGDGVLQRDTAKLATYANYRSLAKDPTIALGRGLLVSGISAGNWSVESDEGINEEIITTISNLFLPLREQLMQSAVSFGRIDFGWQGYEKVFAIKDGRITLDKLKPLLHDITSILVDKNGTFRGFRQYAMGALPIDVPIEKCLLINFGVEGGNLYGTPLLENIRATQAAWDDCNTGAKKYDLKIAGSHWVIKYPPGTSTVDGETVDNGEVAAKLLAALEASGSIAIPTTVAAVLQEITNDSVGDLYAWHVDLLSDTSARQVSFNDRLKYLDALKIRGLILPERSMLEGQFGTKAEAGEHIGLAVTGMQEIDKSITEQINRQCVDQLLMLNYGEEMMSKVRLVAAPLVDLQAAFLRKLYLALVSGNDSAALGIDMDVLKEQLSIPASQPVNLKDDGDGGN